MSAPTRRRFLTQTLGGAAAVAFVPRLAGAGEAPTTAGSAWAPAPPGARPAPPPLPARGSLEDEEFWELVKAQFPLAPGLILMNAANLCPSPYPVQSEVFRLTQDVDADASFQNRGKFGALQEESRAALAGYLGADPDEIAITRNTSESNNTVLNGLTLGAGDEVVIWEQNHPTNNISWDVRAERWGFAVTRIATPPNPTTEAELVGAFEAAITDRTRVIAFSHVSNETGVAQPARALCALARRRGILSLVDGAQTFGALHVDVRDLGCDFYTGSCHKWFVGPKEAGVLYVRAERIPGMWASDVGVGWQGAVERGARKFDNLGQRDDAAVAAVAAAARFHMAIGQDLIEERIRALAAGLKTELRSRIPGVEFHTSDVGERSAGVVVAKLPVDDHRPIYNRLYEEHRIAGANRGGERPGIRLCPHIYNTMAEVVAVAEAMAAAIAD